MAEMVQSFELRCKKHCSRGGECGKALLETGKANLIYTIVDVLNESLRENPKLDPRAPEVNFLNVRLEIRDKYNVFLVADFQDGSERSAVNIGRIDRGALTFTHSYTPEIVRRIKDRELPIKPIEEVRTQS